MKKTLYIFWFCTLFVNCNTEDRDDAELNVVSEDSSSETEINSLETEINDFIWEGLNTWYYWQQDVPDLADSKTDDVTSYINFLNSKPNPESFFDGLLHEDDRIRFGEGRRFSWISDDYRELENQLSGISASDGMKFILYAPVNTNKIIGAVSYVLPNSNAAEKGLIRGDLFNSINGVEMTRDNYSVLLDAIGNEYSISLVNFDSENNTFIPRNIEITLVKEENFQEVPIHKNTIIEHNGLKVGYLMLNRFLSSVDSDNDGQVDRNFNQEMVDTFAEIEAENIDEMVLDLRYNGGGSVLNGVYLASLLTGQFTGEVFIKQLWNNKLNAYIDRVNNDNDSTNDLDFNDYFTNIAPDGSTFNGLNISRLYVLTSRRTASASEMVINGLDPYISEVVVIGEATYGKNVGSITLKDYLDKGSTQDTINPRHFYAMQPIVIKVANVNDEAEYVDGIPPTIEKLEDFGNYGILGDPDEPMLSIALSHMTGSLKGDHTTGKDYAMPSIILPEEESLQQMIYDRPNMKIKKILNKRKLTQKN